MFIFESVIIKHLRLFTVEKVNISQNIFNKRYLMRFYVVGNYVLTFYRETHHKAEQPAQSI